MLVGADFDLEEGDLDFDDVDSSTESFNIFSFQSALAFLMLFGWTALALKTEYGVGKLGTMLGGAGAGLLGAVVSTYLMGLLRKLNSKPLKPKPDVGTIGKVYLAASRTDFPVVVTIDHNGASRQFYAYSSEVLKPNCRIEVTGYEGKYLKVKPLTEVTNV